MKVLHIITGLNCGGAEVILYRLLSKFDNVKYESLVVSLLDPGVMNEPIQSLGVKVESLKIRHGLPSISAVWRLRNIVKNERPDVIQGWMYHGNLAASIAGRFCEGRTPVSWSVHATLYDLKNERLMTRWVIRSNKLLSSHADAVIYVSRLSARQHEALGFDTSSNTVITNCFDTDLFRPNESARVSIRRELGLSEDTLLIGLLARFHPMKDHQNFLNAASILYRDFPSVCYLLAGDKVDNNNDTLVASVGELGLSDRVFLLGERNDMPMLHAALDVTTISSAWGEAFPTVIGEAMSCCVPCVVTDVGDSAFIVGDTGITVPPQDPESLAAAWKNMIERDRDGRQFLGNLGRQRVIENFSLGEVVKQYEDLYDSLIAGKLG